MNRARSIRWYLLLIVALVLAASQSFAESKQKDEERLGKEYSADIEREVKLVKDQAVLDRVKRIGDTLAQVANTTEVPARYGTSDVCKFRYQFKVVEDKDVNAFSLPGGIIYVNTGLLDLVESDDELAGVLAHEIAHAAHHHMSALLRKSSSVDRYVALIALAGILGNVRSRDLGNLLMGAQMMKIGKLSGYTQEAERDADRTAVAYLVKSKYNPEGMLTFMRKLDAKRDANPSLPLGIFQTHPSPFKRVASITKAMREEGIEFDLRRLQDVAYAKPEPVKESQDQYQVVVNNRVVCRPASLGQGPCSKERAEDIAKRINDALDARPKPSDIQEDPSTGCLLVKGAEVLKIEKEDTRAAAGSGAALLEKARSVLEYAVWADWLCNDCMAQELADEE